MLLSIVLRLQISLGAAQAGRPQVRVPTITVLGVKAALAAPHRVQHVQVESACQAAAISPKQSACHTSKIAGEDCSRRRQSASKSCREGLLRESGM